MVSLSSTQRIVFLGRIHTRFCRTPPCGGVAADGPVREIHWFVDEADWCVETNPWSGGMRTPAREVTAAPCGRGRERRGSHVCFAKEQCHRRRQRLPDHGVRERPYAAQVATRLPGTQQSTAADAESRTEPEKLEVLSLRAGSDGGGGDATARQSGPSQLKLSVVPGESKSAST